MLWCELVVGGEMGKTTSNWLHASFFLKVLCYYVMEARSLSFEHNLIYYKLICDMCL